MGDKKIKINERLNNPEKVIRFYVIISKNYRVTIKEIDTFNVVLKRNY